MVLLIFEKILPLNGEYYGIYFVVYVVCHSLDALSLNAACNPNYAVSTGVLQFVSVVKSVLLQSI